MCLHIQPTLRPKVAVDDIVVCKYLNPTYGVYGISPYRDYSYPLGKEVEVSTEDWERTKFDAYAPRARVTGQARLTYGFHSFKEKIEDLSSSSYVYIMGCTAYKAIIPKGSEYYEGVDDFGAPSYVSQKLRVTPELFGE